MHRFIFLAILMMLHSFDWNEYAFAQDKHQESQNPVIGVILPFSSAFKGIALEQQKAVNIALDKYRQGYDVIFKDGGADKESAVKAFNELAMSDDRPQAVISCSSWASDAIHPLAAEKVIFHIAIGSAALERQVQDSTVRFTLDAAREQRQLAKYLDSFERVAIMGMDNDLGNSWMEILRKRFPDSIVAVQAYDPERLDIQAKLEDIKNKNPDALVLISAGEAAAIARQARETGITVQLVGTRPIQRPELLKEPEYTNGLVYTYPSYNTKHQFIEDFQDVYQEKPGVFGVEAFDAITTLVKAFDQGLSTPDELFQWYAGQTFTGALGRVKFDSHGDAIYPYLYKEIVEGRFEIAEFQFPMLLEATKGDLTAIFQEMDQSVAVAAGELSHTGLTGKKARDIIQGLFDENPYVFNSVTVDKEGIIVNVAPDRYDDVIGEEISSQEQIIRLHETHEPVLSQAIPMVEGFVSIDLEHPVFDPDHEFIGSVSILFKPDFLGSVIEQKLYNFPVEIFVVQTDGTTIYDINEEEIGRNAFDDPMYEEFPSLLQAARRVVSEPEGQDRYRFLDSYMEQSVEKNIIWTTIGLHGTEYRLVLSYSGS